MGGRRVVRGGALHTGVLRGRAEQHTALLNKHRRPGLETERLGAGGGAGAGPGWGRGKAKGRGVDISENSAR